MKNHIFISHSTKDDLFVKFLRKELERQGMTTWVDSRELIAGNKLEPEIENAIDIASAFIVVISRNAFNSAWVLEETKRAINKQNSAKDFPVIPLLIDGSQPGSLNYLFKEEPVAIMVSDGPGGLGEAMPQILAALKKRLPNDSEKPEIVENLPVDELLLELTSPRMKDEKGIQRAAATAKLTYIPASEGARSVESRERFTFVSPIGPIEKDDISWYLEKYSIWPTGVFKTRAEKAEANLPEWGFQLFNRVMNNDSVKEVIAAWKTPDRKTIRRFTIFVDPSLEQESAKEKKAEAQEAATLLLSLPWELLHDETGYIFLGAKPVHVRRAMPNKIDLDVVPSKPPVRVLFVCPRPEDETTTYIDHRITALPLAEALENLGELAELTILTPPTFKALQEVLNKALQEERPYHVVHFDGHGVYNKKLGLGALCFEDPKDSNKLHKRKSQNIDAKKIAKVIREHRIPLFFLEACQSAKAEEDPTASVAAALLEQGTASVIAMSHSVLVETARRFVSAFYKKLITGSRVGEAMLAGRQELESNSYRGKDFGAGLLHLQDWFVPVLFQEKEDIQLFKKIPSLQAIKVDKKGREKSIEELPDPPSHNFTGRSRELLGLERLLIEKPYAVLRGQGGEGKTTLAVEFAGWMVKSGRFDRAAFVNMEKCRDVRTALDSIGTQLTTNYSVAVYTDFNKATLPVERALEDDSTLIIFDNMETVLPPQTSHEDSALSNGVFEPIDLKEILNLCKILLISKKTRILFTSRGQIPAPFDQAGNIVNLTRLDKNDAIKLVRNKMAEEGLTPKEEDKHAPPEIEALVESVNCHARSLVLLAPNISELGLKHTTENLAKLMIEMEKKFPGSREKSLFASVELSLQKLTPEIRKKISVLGLFQGGANFVVLMMMLELDQEGIEKLASELIGAGLAEIMGYGHLRLHPALPLYLMREIDETVFENAKEKWMQGMKELAGFLGEQLFKDKQLSSTLTLLELRNLLRLLKYLKHQDNPKETVKWATNLEALLQSLGRPHSLKEVSTIREEEARKIGDWNHTAFNAAQNNIDRMMEGGNLRQAMEQAQSLLGKCLSEGKDAYPEVEYDTAMAYWLFGRVLSVGYASEEALKPITEAQKRFQALTDRGNEGAANMVTVSSSEMGACLLSLGRLDEAAKAYEECIKRDEKLRDARGVAVGKAQLGAVRLSQKRYKEALDAYESARKTFEELSEPTSVSTAWHQIGMVHEKAGNYEAAETAYRKSLTISIEQKDKAGEADSLVQLGNLYNKMGRLEEAVVFYRQASDRYREIGDMAKEGVARSNIAIILIGLKRFDEAREEITRAIEIKAPYGHAAEPWLSWCILHDLEEAVGNREAAEKARKKAIELFLAYRRDGGENHEFGGRLCAMLLQSIKEGKKDEIEKGLKEQLDRPGAHPQNKALIQTLQKVLSELSNLDRPALINNPALNYRDVAEVTLLLERL